MKKYSLTYWLSFFGVLLIGTESGSSNPFTNTTFSRPDSLKTTSSQFIHLGVVLKIINENSSVVEFTEKFEIETNRLFSSIFKNSDGTPLHYILITDSPSLPRVNYLLKNCYTRHIVENLLRIYPGKKLLSKVPKIVLDYVEIRDIKESGKDLVNTMKATVYREKISKYNDDLFFIAPIYHRAFVNLDKLLMLDHDLEFLIDVRILWEEYIPPPAVMGITLDLQPFYHILTKKFREENPESLVGTVGKHQGYNTGVVLFNLERMRKSELYNRLLEPAAVFPLLFKYGIALSVGDQDYFTSMGYEEPSLFHVLPCEYNVQKSQQWNISEYADIYPIFHNCPKPWNVVHRNGCGVDEGCHIVYVY